MGAPYSTGEPCRDCGGRMTFVDDGSKTPPFCMDCRNRMARAITDLTKEGRMEHEAAAWLQKDDAAWTGRLNIYTCRTCRGHVVTRDRDPGVTPFMMACRATTGCKGHMESSMYRVFDQDMQEQFEWYRPPAVQVLSDWEADHVRKGGLLLRPATRATS